VEYQIKTSMADPFRRHGGACEGVSRKKIGDTGASCKIIWNTSEIGTMYLEST
jgi:hypothetical protein